MCRYLYWLHAIIRYLILRKDQVRDVSTSMHHVRADYLLIPVECRTTCYSQEHFGELTDVNARHVIICQRQLLGFDLVLREG
jgi:hypothetical protein